MLRVRKGQEHDVRVGATFSVSEAELVTLCDEWCAAVASAILIAMHAWRQKFRRRRSRLRVVFNNHVSQGKSKGRDAAQHSSENTCNRILFEKSNKICDFEVWRSNRIDIRCIVFCEQDASGHNSNSPRRHSPAYVSSLKTSLDCVTSRDKFVEITPNKEKVRIPPFESQQCVSLLLKRYSVAHLFWTCSAHGSVKHLKSTPDGFRGNKRRQALK